MIWLLCAPSLQCQSGSDVVRQSGDSTDDTNDGGGSGGGSGGSGGSGGGSGEGGGSGGSGGGSGEGGGGNSGAGGATFTFSNSPTGFDFVDSDGNPITSVAAESTITVFLRDTASNTSVLAFTANGDVDFTNVTAGTFGHKSWVHFPALADKAGITGNVTLFIPATPDATRVVICPEADDVTAITAECPSVVSLTAEAPTHGNYTWANPDRLDDDPFEIVCPIENFGTGGMGESFYTIGGTVSGLNGTLVLQNNDTDDLSITQNGSFEFVSTLGHGDTYDVSVLTQPSNPLHQTCLVTHGRGIIAFDQIMDVTITCTTHTFTVSGTISGLVGSVVLQNNGGDDLTVSQNGVFNFATRVMDGSDYEVTVLSQPSDPVPQTCFVASNTGTIANANATDVIIGCINERYTVSATAGSHGNVTPSTPQVVTGGDDVLLIATPNDHHAVHEWVVDGTVVQTGGTTLTLSNVVADHTVSVSFSIIQHSVTPSAGSNGSISPGTVQTVNDGNSIVFTATPSTYYHVNQWSVDGSVVQSGGNDYTLSNVTDAHTVSVNFGITQYTVTPSAGSNGSISPSTPQTVNNGSTINFTATPNDDSTVKHWLVDGSIVQTGGTSFSLATITSAKSVSVVFKKWMVFVSDDRNNKVFSCTVTSATGALSNCTASNLIDSTYAPFQIAFATVNGSIYGYVVRSPTTSGASTVRRCAVDASTGALSNCRDPGFGLTIPSSTLGVTIATLGSNQYAYFSPNTGSAAITMCTINQTSDANTNGLFGTCATTPSSSVPGWQAFGTTLATYNGFTYYAYVAGSDGVYKCAVNSLDGTLSSCAVTPSSGTIPSWTPNGVTVGTSSGTPYLYVGAWFSNIYKCSVSTGDGTITPSSCVTTPSTGTTGDSRSVAFATIDSTQYAYIADIGGKVYKCTVDSDGTFNSGSCSYTSSPVSPSWAPRTVTVLSVP